MYISSFLYEFYAILANQISLRKLKFANLNCSLKKQKIFLPHHQMLYQRKYGFLSWYRRHKLRYIYSILSIVQTHILERLLNELKWNTLIIHKWEQNRLCMLCHGQSSKSLARLQLRGLSWVMYTHNHMVRVPEAQSDPSCIRPSLDTYIQL